MTEHLVRTPEYEGPERRRELRIERCVCHLKHESKLVDHDKRLDKLENGSKTDHNDMWSDIKQKVPLKLFYVALGLTFTALGYIVVQLSIQGMAISKIQTAQQSMKENSLRIERSVERMQNDLHQHIVNCRRQLTGNSP